MDTSAAPPTPMCPCVHESTGAARLDRQEGASSPLRQAATPLQVPVSGGGLAYGSRGGRGLAGQRVGPRGGAGG
jgi:hypothetical protein